MSKLITSILLIFCALTLSAQPKDTKVKFDRVVYDFGKIEESKGPVTCHFSFLNSGTEPLYIYTINASCGCTIPEWDKAPVMPGKRGEVKVAFNPKGFPGEIQKSIEIVGNIPGGKVKLLIKGYVIPVPRGIEEDYPYIKADGLRLNARGVDMGNIPRREVSYFTLGMANGSNKPINIDVDRMFLPDYLTFAVAKTTLLPGEKSELKVKFDASKIDKWGLVEFSFPLIINGVMQMAFLNGRCVLIENFSHLTKEQLRNAPISEYSSYFCNFGEFSRRKKVEQNVYLSNIGEDDLIIRHLDFNGGKLHVSSDMQVVKQGQTATITIKLKNTERVGDISEDIRVITNDPMDPVYEIRVIATIK